MTAVSPEEWVGLLGDAVLTELDPPTGTRITLFIDDDFIAGLPSGCTADGLAAAVRGELAAPGAAMFQDTLRRCRMWAIGDEAGPPPSLPLLALSILAASRMDHDGEGHASTNYYLRLAQLLAADPAQVPIWRRALSAHYGAVDELWEQLRSWLERQGWTSTIRRHPTLVHVGYPMSQAIVRASDRRVLTQFWELIGAGGGAGLEPQTIADGLRRWIRDQNRGLGAGLVQALADDDEAAWISQVLAGLAQSWDGRVQERDGTPLRRLRLTAAIRDGRPHLAWEADDGTSRKFEAQQLRTGATWRQDGALYRAAPRSIAVLQYDDWTGRWAEAALEPMIPLALVYGEDAGDAVQEFLRQVVPPGGRHRVRPVRTDGAWFARIPATGDRALNTAARKLQDLLGTRIVDELTAGNRPRARLVHGLPVDNAVSNSLYFVGGAPDLAHPSGPLGEAVEVVLHDGDGEHRQPLRRDALPLPLRGRFTAAGHYRGTAQGSAFGFELVEDSGGLPGRPARDAVGLEPGCWEAATDPGPQAAAGAVLPGDHRAELLRTVWLPRGCTERFLIGPMGAVRPVPEPGPGPLWAALFDGCDSQVFCCHRRRDEGWLALCRGSSLAVRELAPVPHHHPAQGDVDWQLWRWVLARYAAAGGTPAWHRLLGSAGLEAERRR